MVKDVGQDGTRARENAWIGHGADRDWQVAQAVDERASLALRAALGE